MFLLKTLDIVTKHCKKTLQESTFIRSSQKGMKKKSLTSYWFFIFINFYMSITFRLWIFVQKPC